MGICSLPGMRSLTSHVIGDHVKAVVYVRKRMVDDLQSEKIGNKSSLQHSASLQLNNIFACFVAKKFLPIMSLMVNLLQKLFVV